MASGVSVDGKSSGKEASSESGASVAEALASNFESIRAMNIEPPRKCTRAATFSMSS